MSDEVQDPEPQDRRLAEMQQQINQLNATVHRLAEATERLVVTTRESLQAHNARLRLLEARTPEEVEAAIQEGHQVLTGGVVMDPTAMPEDP